MHVMDQITLLNLALDHIREAAYLMDESGRLHYVNAESCRILGYTREELLGLSATDINPNFSSTMWAEYWEQLMTQRSKTFETTHRRKDGRLVPVEINANYLEFEGRAYNLALSRDITERRNADLELVMLKRAVNTSSRWPSTRT
jgi:PAS domain S-box-containing protein